MLCFKCSDEEVMRLWRYITDNRNIMTVYVAWCIWLSRRGYKTYEYKHATMHHYPEFVAFLTRKKLTGELR